MEFNQYLKCSEISVEIFEEYTARELKNSMKDFFTKNPDYQIIKIEYNFGITSAATQYTKHTDIIHSAFILYKK
jgi:hypothetical protein